MERIVLQLALHRATEARAEEMRIIFDNIRDAVSAGVRQAFRGR